MSHNVCHSQPILLKYSHLYVLYIKKNTQKITKHSKFIRKFKLRSLHPCTKRHIQIRRMHNIKLYQATIQIQVHF